MLMEEGKQASVQREPREGQTCWDTEGDGARL